MSGPGQFLRDCRTNQGGSGFGAGATPPWRFFGIFIDESAVVGAVFAGLLHPNARLSKTAATIRL